MTKGIEEEKAIETIAVIVNDIYKYVKDTRARFEAYKN